MEAGEVPLGGDKKKVLVVEDDFDTRECVRFALEGAGYPVATAANGREALAYLNTSKHPCLILLDMMMPVMGGDEFLSVLKHNDMLAPIPVVMVSATPDNVSPLAGQLQGFIRKPVDLEILLAFVRKYC